MKQLAILGGEPAVCEGMLRPWPPIGDLDREYVMASLEGGQHTFGPNCTKLEEEFAAWNGNAYAVTTNSGTAALHMAVAATGCGCGDHVIVPAYSWSSSVTCVVHHNCLPVFVDIDYDTMNIDPAKIEAAITPRTRAIIIVHLHGLAADLEAILDIARRHNLKVIEDCCQAHGALVGGRKVGTWGHCAAFSFNQNKCLCSGEGGMLVTNDEAVHERARQVWSFGETRTPVESRDYHAYALGWMYRNNDLTAAFGRAQLARLDNYIQTQRENAAVLLHQLQDVPGLIAPTVRPGFVPSWYNFTTRIDMQAIGWDGEPSRMRDAVLKALNAEGVPASVWQRWILPAMTVFQARNAYGQGCPWSCPYTEQLPPYLPDDFPVAQKHSETHFGMTTPLRAPHGPEVARAVAEGIRKVFSNLDKLDVDKILEEE